MNILKATLRDNVKEKCKQGIGWMIYKNNIRKKHQNQNQKHNPILFSNMNLDRIIKHTKHIPYKTILPTILLILTTILILTPFITTSYANTLVDESVGTYSSYPLENYQLDFYVDTGWDWLPWNWTDGIGKQVMYGLYAITNFIWIISLYLSNATGYLVEQVYTLDFISSTANSIGKHIQTLAGVSTLGFSNDGFYTGFLLIFVLILGIYVSYVGIIKKESSKAIGAVFNFILVFVLSAAFIAHHDFDNRTQTQYGNDEGKYPKHF